MIGDGFGMFEPQSSNVDNVNVAPVEEAVSPPEISSPESTPKPSVVTQNTEETVFVEADQKKAEEEKEKQKKLKAEEDRRRLAAEAERKLQEEKQKQLQAINNQVAGAFGGGNAQGSGQGTGSSQGNQGSPQGNSNQGAGSGVGGYGEFSLNGRSLGSEGLPRPIYSIQEEGRIVIDITVDKNGNIILATIGKGTNIDNATMRKAALNAAKKAKFNAISRNENQSGTITYKFYLK